QILRFDEDLAEGWMCEIVRGGCQHDLGVARHIDFTDARAIISDSDPPHFDVVLGRDRYVELGRQIIVSAPEARPVGRKGHRVLVGFASRWLKGRRPYSATAHVAQVNELTVSVTRGVAAPAGHRASGPDAVAALRLGPRRH